MQRMIDNDGFDVGCTMVGWTINSACIWFTYEDHFHLDGFVKSQNWRFWGTPKLVFCKVRILNLQKVNVWTAVSRKVMIGPSHFQETINTERYIASLEQFVARYIYNWGSTRHFLVHARWCSTSSVFVFPEEYFGNKLMVFDICWNRHRLVSILNRYPLRLHLWAALQYIIFSGITL